MKIKKLSIFLMCVAVISVSVFSFITLTNKNKVTPGQVEGLYVSEAQTLEWFSNTSDLIIKAKAEKKLTAQDGIIPLVNKETVYTDTVVKVIEVYKDITGKSVSVGDLITIRVLGGKTAKLENKSDTDGIMDFSGEMILGLAETSKLKIIPVGTELTYSLVGGVHGAFNINADGTAERTKIGEKIQLKDLLDKIK